MQYGVMKYRVGQTITFRMGSGGKHLAGREPLLGPVCTAKILAVAKTAMGPRYVVEAQGTLGNRADANWGKVIEEAIAEAGISPEVRVQVAQPEEIQGSEGGGLLDAEWLGKSGLRRPIGS